MPYKVLQYPPGIFPSEARADCPEAEALIDVFIRQMAVKGPSPDGYPVKNLGKKMGGLWQLNLKAEGRQVRVLYAPYKEKIVIFHVHKKSSAQEQERAYAKAMKRKAEYDKLQAKADKAHDGTGTKH